MHRQSLGSPSSKLHLHHHHGVAVVKEEETLIAADEPPKPHRLSASPSPTPHKFIHLIPIITLLCFFILFLFSNTPSPSDLDNFTGFKRLQNHHLAVEMNDIGEYMDGKRSDILTIRSLQQIPKPRLHRKLADF